MIDGGYIEMGGFLVKIFNDRWGEIWGNFPKKFLMIDGEYVEMGGGGGDL